MKSTEKERLAKQTEKRYLWLRFKNGCKSLKGSNARRYALIAFYILVMLIWIFNKERFSLENVELVSPAFVALSKLTLPITLIGGTAAAEQIPKDAAGRFLLHDGTIFQVFWFDDTDM